MLPCEDDKGACDAVGIHHTPMALLAISMVRDDLIDIDQRSCH